MPIRSTTPEVNTAIWVLITTSSTTRDLARHWSHYYEEFTRAAEKDDGHPAIVMQKDQFGPLALVAALWRKDYPAIARYARLRDVPEDNAEELARIVRERARPKCVGAFWDTGPRRRCRDPADGRSIAEIIRRLRRADQKDGKELFKSKTPSGIIGGYV